MENIIEEMTVETKHTKQESPSEVGNSNKQGFRWRWPG
jgi:hypothetical protein